MPQNSIAYDSIEQKHSPKAALSRLCELGHGTQFGEFRLLRVALTEGLRAGVEVLLVDSGRIQAALLPTRGMGLWQVRIDGRDYLWNSPAPGPVHPQHVPLSEPSGIGWLDGFDELLVRCGLRSFGAPDFGPQGQLLHPLHGRIANLPAENIALQLNEHSGALEISADVVEARFLVDQLKLTAKTTFRIGEPVIEIDDTVTNTGNTPTTSQLLYHINIGNPALHAGARMYVSGDRVVARDARAVEDLESWQVYRGPTPGYTEQVYYSRSFASPDGWAKALLAAADDQSGFAVHYRPHTLPYFSQWKNTVGPKDGYVTGFEPGTGFPNTRTFEESKGRVVPLAAGESRTHSLKLEGISSQVRIAELIQELDNNHDGNPVAAVEFDPAWCMPRA